MGKTLKRARARAAAEAAGTALRPAKRGSGSNAAAPSTPAHQHQQQQQPSASKLAELVTTALQRREWQAALKHLAKMRALGRTPKLGSLQRWVSMADAAGSERIAAALICAALKAAGQAPIDDDGGGVVDKPQQEQEQREQQQQEQQQREQKQDPARRPPPVRRFPPWSPPRVGDDGNGAAAAAADPSGDPAAAAAVALPPSQPALPAQPPQPYELERAPEGGGDRFAAGAPARIYAFPPGAAVRFDASHPPARRVDVPFVPGAFVLVGALSRSECAQLLAAGKLLGFQRGVDYSFSAGAGAGGGAGGGGSGISAFDAAQAVPAPASASHAAAATADVSAARVVAAREAGMPPVAGRPAEGCVLMADDTILGPIWRRVRHLLPQRLGGGDLVGLNPRLRSYRYTPGAVYRPHVDGAWPRSGLDGQGRYVFDADEGGAWSRLTFLIYLNGDDDDGKDDGEDEEEGNFEGGATTFFAPSADADGCLDARGVRPRRGNVLVFPHGDTAGALVHEGSPVSRGAKYVIRTEVVYSRPPRDASGRRAAAPAAMGDDGPSAPRL